MHTSWVSWIALALLAGPVQPAIGGSETSISRTDRGVTMKHAAKGAFDVKLQPLEAYNRSEGAGLGRMSIDKQFHGDLEATSQGEMLYAGNTKDTGGYVAVERVTGTLQGKRGAFSLQHNATRTPADAHLDIIVVPGSGTGELAGISGKMKIVIAEGGKHYYEFDYELAE